MATIVFVFRSLTSNTNPKDPEPRTERNSKSGSGIRLDILKSYDILMFIHPPPKTKIRLYKMHFIN